MIYILGPTSSGKTSLALKVCKKFNKEIVSADSRQIYKDFDVGTGKLPLASAGVFVEKNSGYWVLDGIKIHMYDVCDANNLYTVSDYLNDTKNLIGEDKIIVGGTGLYIDNLLGLKKPSPVPPNIKLRFDLEKKSPVDLRLMLPKEILDSMNQSDINNPRRLIRKIEVLKYESENSSTNKKWEIFDNPKSSEIPYVIVLDIPREELFNRIDLWVDTIWNPLLEEAKNLVSLGYEDSFSMNGIIYKTVLGFIRQKISKHDAVRTIKNDLHAYIRRQQTWFKTYTQDYVHRFDSSDKAFSFIESILAN